MKRMNPWIIFALICTALGSCGAIILTIVQLKSSEADNLALTKNLDEIKKEREVLSETLAIRDANISSQNKSIHDLSLKLAEKSEYIQNYLTGGNGYLFLDMRKLSVNGTNFMFQLDNKFDLPLYNILCEVFDYEIIKKLTYHKPYSTQSFIKLNDYKSAKIISEEFSEIGAKRHITIDRVFPVKDCLYYAFIRARNQTVTAKLTILIVGQGDYYGFQIMDQKGNLLEEDINKAMPKEISNMIRQRLNSIPNTPSYSLE